MRSYPTPGARARLAMVDGKAHPIRHPAADGAIEHLRGLLDPVGGGVQGVGDRGLGRLGAVRRDDADVAQARRTPPRACGCG